MDTFVQKLFLQNFADSTTAQMLIMSLTEAKCVPPRASRSLLPYTRPQPLSMRGGRLHAPAASAWRARLASAG